MRVLMYRDGGERRLGAILDGRVVDLPRLARERTGERLPETILELIDGGEEALALARRCLEAAGSDDGERYSRPLDEVHILPPLDPPRGNVVAIGRNYQAHAEESARARNQEVKPPTVFSKAQTSIIGPYDDVPLHAGITKELDWEAELAVVVGRTALDVGVEEALGYVFGYTVLNDVSARDIQHSWGGQFFKGKSLDGTCPIGPWIVTADEVPDPQTLHILLRINGETKQDASTSDMIYPVADQIARLSMGMTLLPGTLIATGTPAGVGMGRTPQEFLKAGDVIETEIEGIGLLRNRVVSAG